MNTKNYHANSSIPMLTEVIAADEPDFIIAPMPIDGDTLTRFEPDTIIDNPTPSKASVTRQSDAFPVLSEPFYIPNKPRHSIPPVEQDIIAPLAFNNAPQTDWAALEKSLNEKILRQLQTRIDQVIEHRIKEGLAEVLTLAVNNLSSQLRAGLTKSLEDVIQRAVSQEISKLQSNQTKSNQTKSNQTN